MLKMKKYLLLIVILAVAWPTLFGNSGAQSITEIPQEPDTLYGWNLTDVSYIREHKDAFVNIKMDSLYHIMQKRGMIVKDVWTKETSPYADPYKRGRSYVRGLYLYSKNIEDIDKGDIFYRIDITLDFADNDTTIRGPKFWQSFDSNIPEVDQFIQKTKDLVIREIDIQTKMMRY